ncbi:MAG: hypothetical protein K2M65_04590 [Muribaculaceae bacterium]|nr:hypothetical protein [Muribaculaceae bacterium]
MKFKRLFIAAAVTAGTLVGAQAQSAYSMFGYGTLNDNATSSQVAMGGVGYAMRSGRQINVMNPASYAAIDSLTFLFDIGVDLTKIKAKDADATSSTTGGGLQYVNIQFPLGKYMGASVGMLPFSTVQYSFGDEIVNGHSAYQGSGGINQAYVGVAGRPVMGLTLGFNFSYMFGTLLNDIYGYGSTTGTGTLWEKTMEVRDWRLQLGAQYGLKIGSKHQATVGLTYAPGKDLAGHAWATRYDINASSSTEPEREGYTSLRHKYSLPDTWGVGVNYEWNERLMAEFDATYQNWAKAKYASIDTEDSNIKFANRYKYAFGVQYRHSQRANYLQRINWRAGAFTSRDYVTIQGNHINEYGLSCGLGLPTPAGNKTMLNLTFQYVHREGSPAKLISENHFNISLGININELWFMPAKLR